MSQRVRIIKDFDMHREGEVKVVDNNVAHGLIERGVAIISKDVVKGEVKIKKAVKKAVRKPKKFGFKRK